MRRKMAFLFPRPVKRLVGSEDSFDEDSKRSMLIVIIVKFVIRVKKREKNHISNKPYARFYVRSLHEMGALRMTCPGRL